MIFMKRDILLKEKTGGWGLGVSVIAGTISLIAVLMLVPKSKGRKKQEVQKKAA
jgi:hypothetical protein